MAADQFWIKQFCCLAGEALSLLAASMDLAEWDAMPGQPRQPQQEHHRIKLREMLLPSGLAVASPLPACVLPARLHADCRLRAPLRMCHKERLTLVVVSCGINRFIKALMAGRVKPEMSFRAIAQLRELEHILINPTNRHNRFRFEARRCMISLQHSCRHIRFLDDSSDYDKIPWTAPTITIDLLFFLFSVIRWQ